jgi:hypothetical protein
VPIKEVTCSVSGKLQFFMKPQNIKPVPFIVISNCNAGKLLIEPTVIGEIVNTHHRTFP